MAGDEGEVGGKGRSIPFRSQAGSGFSCTLKFSAEEHLIARAREEADRRGTTLNAEFRLWLSAFVEQERTAQSYRELMARLAYARAGRRFRRDELNER